MLNLIVAHDISRGIGFDNKLPWHLSNDLKRFKKLTEGHAVLMGRKTHESIGKVLPNRENIILTHDRGYRADNCYIINYLTQLDAYMSKNPEKDVFVIGGSEIYKLMLPYVDRLYISIIPHEYQCDAYFPEFNYNKYELTEVKDCYDHIFHVYDRKSHD